MSERDPSGDALQQADSRMPSLCIINFNGASFLDETIRAAKTAGGVSEILLIDNGSEDESIAIARRIDPAIHIRELGDNRGPARARNEGFREAGNNRIAFIDNDVSIESGCIERLNEALDRDPEAVIAMPRVLYDDRSDTIQYDGAGCHFLGLMTLENANRPAADVSRDIRKIDAPVTAAFLMDRSRWRGGDPFDESFFIYLEDLEFGLRARTMGHSILSVPSAVVTHREGTAGLALRRTGRYASRRIFSNIRNRWQIILIHFQWRTLLALAPALALFEVFQLVGVLVKGWWGEWWRAVCWIAGHAGEISHKRNVAGNSRRVPDGEILRGGAVPFAEELATSPLERLGRRILDSLTAVWWTIARPVLARRRP